MKCEVDKAYLDGGPRCDKEASKAWKLDDDRVVKLCGHCSDHFWAALGGPEEIPLNTIVQTN